MPAKDPNKLTDKEARFCDEYLIDLNATQAAIRAGYSEKSAGVIGFETLKKPKVQERIQALQKNIAERNGVTQDRIIKELARIAFVDIASMFQDDGTLKPMSELTEEQTRAIGSIKEFSYTYGDGSEKATKEFKLNDKLSAIEKLMKHLGMFDEDNRQKQPKTKIRVSYGNKKE